MINVLVTGGYGQLANNIKDIAVSYPQLSFIYKGSDDLDIIKSESLENEFKKTKIDYCINCAAYTAVDKAEKDKEQAFQVNEKGVKNLAEICSKYGTTLIHISTDFVYDGNTSMAYKEIDKANPLGVYGQSKLKGEEVAQKIHNKCFILRTSWLYSEHNKNFMKTMIRLSESNNKLTVIDDQIGTPTYAKDLAEVILRIIDSRSQNYGIYHYSNEGVASWYDFAVAIFDEIKSEIEVIPIKTKDYPTPARRPIFSVLDKSKIKNSLQIKIPHWRQSLKKAIENVTTQKK